MIKLLKILAALALATPFSAYASDFRCYNVDSIPHQKITLFGETHGTYESPSIVAEHVCRLAKETPVILTLEIPLDEQPSIDQYLISQGNKDDRANLLRSKFWADDWQDGRASIAMFSLIDRIRELKSSGASIAIIVDDGFSAKDRDLQMSQAILNAVKTHPNTAIVGLYGNYHTGEIVGTRSDRTRQKIGYRLRELNPLTISIDFERGWAWVCAPNCGITKMGRWEDSIDSPKFEFVPNERNGHDALLTLPKVNAAPPAKFMANEG